VVLAEQPPVAGQGLLVHRDGLPESASAQQVDGRLVQQPQPLLGLHLQAITVLGNRLDVKQQPLTLRPAADLVAREDSGAARAPAVSWSNRST
jgi:hypothetical protein